MKLLKIDMKTLGKFKRVRNEAISEAKILGKPRKGKIRVLGISGSARDQYDTAQESSNSEELLRGCLEHCKKLGAETQMIQLRKEDIKYCKACYSTVNTQCHSYCSCYPKGTKQGDDMSNKIYDQILWADAIIFATPVNNFAMSTKMKAFIDRCISLDGSLHPADPKSPKNRELNIKHMKFIEETSDPDVPGSGMLRRFNGKVAGVIVTGHEEGASMVISSLFMTLSHFGMLFPPFGNMYALSSYCDSTYRDKDMLIKNGCYGEDVKSLAENVMNASKLSRRFNPMKWKYDPRMN